jgi:putative DNA methylase
MTPTYRKKLIEVALPLEDINREAAREKSIRHGHPSTLHLWWARRPLAACRAVLFSSLVDDPSECVTELLADETKRKAAEKELVKRTKGWAVVAELFGKAKAAGISAPEPGPQPTLESILVETERERLFDIIRELVKWENSNNDRVLNAARAEIMRSCDGKPPPVYDPFCGGGSIPLEAQRLGLEAHASDLNPVPVLINKALIEIPPKFAGKPPVNPEAKKKLSASGSWKGASGLAEDVRYYGQWMRDEAEKRIGHLYPKVKLPKEQGGGEATVIAWLWARTVASPNPAAKGAHVPLVRSFRLSTKADKRTWLEPIVDQETMTYRFEIHTGIGEARPATVSRTGGICILTGSPMPLDYIRAEGKAGRMGIRLLGIVAEGARGRIYLSPPTEHERIATDVNMGDDIPESDLPRNPRDFKTPNYGMTKHRHLFTKRQLSLLTNYSALVEAARAKMLASSGNGTEYADAVATYLALGVSKTADYNSSLVVWSHTRNQAKSTFARQALAMVWDFAEVNPFAGAAGDFRVSLDGIARTIQQLAVARIGGHAEQLSAAKLSPATKVLFSTDPPYYDNIGYADLSDFFYIWLRRSIQTVYPSLLGTLLVPKAEELIADCYRQGSKDTAREFFETGMRNVFARMRELSDERFPTTVYYAFKQTEAEDDDDEEDDSEDDVRTRTSTGWETFLQGLVDTQWQVDGTWPMRTERGARNISIGKNALASSIVLVCRPLAKDASAASRRDFLAALKRELPEALRNLQKGNIAPVDLAQAAIGPGMAVFSRYAKVLETDGSAMGVRTALSLINQSLDEVLAEQEGEFDPDTRWALAWFDQSGFTEGAYGTAETLSTAKNTSMSGMVEAGILTAKGGKVRLFTPEELPADWDPQTDARLTIWEGTHQLIRALTLTGEAAAAALLARLPVHVTDPARDLAYRLYSTCERKKWAKEALAYNALVLSWPEIRRLAQDVKTRTPTQTDLFA